MKTDDWINPAYDQGLFSVIVPTFNRADTILQSLDSVKAQTYRPIEVIVADDGSTDDTEPRVREWIQANQEPQFVINYTWRENQGVCGARNDALRESRGEFIQYLDSDDLLHRDRLEKLARLFDTEDCDYIETGFEGFREDDATYSEQHMGHPGQCQFSLLLRGRLWPNTLRAAYRRGLVKRIGPWRVGMSTFQDLDYVIRAFTLDPRPRLGAIHGVLASARRSGKRMSDTFKMLEGRRLRVECEAMLIDRVAGRPEFDDEDCRALRARCLTLAIRTVAAGWGAETEVLLDAISRLPQRYTLTDHVKFGILIGGRPACWLACKVLRLAK